jgi:two-component system, cell cycle sensor histidine kinase and response regulator CckA
MNEKHNSVFGRNLAVPFFMAQILLIDDESNILDLLRTILVSLGHEVKAAHDGQEGIDLFENGYNFDLVITDIRMPRVDGNQVAEHIRGSGKPNIPIVAISGYSKEIDKRFFDFSIEKPFGIETIVNLLEKLKRENRIGCRNNKDP